MQGWGKDWRVRVTDLSPEERQQIYEEEKAKEMTNTPVSSIAIIPARYLTLKIAVGVFVGVFAVLGVRALPDWIEKQLEDNARTVISSLTPDKILAQCGPPIDDKTENIGSKTTPIVYRTMSYANEFIPKNPWRIRFYVTEEGRASGPSIEDDWKMYKDVSNRTKLRALPCLNK